MRIPLILIASIALMSQTACSNEDSEPNVQKPDASMQVYKALNEWKENQAMEGLRDYFTPGIKSRGGKTVIVGQGFGESIEMAFCSAMADIASNSMVAISSSSVGNLDTISKKIEPLKMSSNLTVSHQSTASRGYLNSSQGNSSKIESLSSQTDVNLFDFKLSCELSDNSEKIVSSLVHSRTPGCESNERMREFLDNEMKKEGHRILKSFWAANCKGKVIEEEHYALILVVRPN